MPDAPASNAFPTTGNWSDEQLKVAFAFYCQTPFGMLHSRNPKIVELAGLIQRSPGALAMKLGNFASLDPSITATGRSGLTGASAKDRAIWAAFHANWEQLAMESDELLRQLWHERGIQPAPEQGLDPRFDLEDYTGETRRALSRQRIKQDFFRRAVLASYSQRCCITDVSEPRLLVASHIVAWSEDKANRLNPSNGLCLSAIHDRAFDQHMFSLDEEYRIVLSATLKRTTDEFLRRVFWASEGKPIKLPERFAPDLKLIARHRQITLQSSSKEHCHG